MNLPEALQIAQQTLALAANSARVTARVDAVLRRARQTRRGSTAPQSGSAAGAYRKPDFQRSLIEPFSPPLFESYLPVKRTCGATDCDASPPD